MIVKNLNECLLEILKLKDSDAIIIEKNVSEMIGCYFFHIKTIENNVEENYQIDLDDICKYIGYEIEDNESEVELLDGDLTIALQELKDFLDKIVI